MILIVKDKVTGTIKNAINYLKKNQNDDGSISINDDKRWKVWETAHSFISLNMLKERNEEDELFLEKAINFLLSAKRKDGSFSYKLTRDEENYCMETTAVAILALHQAKKDVKKSINFIKKKQNDDGSWEIGIPEIYKRRCWPSVTGFVLDTLLNIDNNSKEISKGINYLLKTQKEDGSWGSNWIYYDTPYYPIHVIMSVFKKKGMEKSESYKKSKEFIVKNQNKEGYWSLDKTEKPRPSENLRSSLALNSLLISPKKSEWKTIERGINYLLTTQTIKGNWDGGYFVNWPGKKEDIYSTTMCIRALILYNTQKGRF